jgi:hypothetical protein
MKPIAIITVKEENPTIDNKTAESISKNNLEWLECRYTDNEEKSLNDLLEASKEKLKDYTHVLLIPNESFLNDNYLDVISHYVKEDKVIYLPLVSYYEHVEDKEEPQFRGLLNSSLWKPFLNEEVGVLTPELGFKQIDFTLYGGLIPVKVLEENKLASDIKFYSQYEFIHKVLEKEESILGVPKALVNLTKDYTLKNENEEEKRKWFDFAKKEYIARRQQNLKAKKA